MTLGKKTIRKEDVEKILKNHPDNVPIIVSYDGKDGNGTKNYRFIVRPDITPAQFLTIFRRKIKLRSTEAIYIFIINNKQVILPIYSSSMTSLYQEHKDENLILNIRIEKENSFG